LYFLYGRNVRVFVAFIVLAVATIYANSLGRERVVLEAGFIFDIYILISLLFGFLFAFKNGIHKKLVFLFWGWVFIFLVYFLYSISLPQDFIKYEFLRSARFFLYVFSFLLVANYSLVGPIDRDTSDFNVFFILLPIFFIVFYFYKIAVWGTSRPWLFSENNFEMAMFISIMIVYLGSIADSRFNVLGWIALIFISFISFSKSAVLEVVSSGFAKFKIKSLPSILLLLVFSIVGIAGVYLVFEARLDGSSLYDIDRVLFLKVFWSEFSRGGWLNFIFGYGPARNLEFNSCMILEFWVNSMFEDAQYCNAAVFHSLFMRMAFEYGILFLVILIFTWYKLLTLIYGKRIGLAVFLVIAISSLSVSGFSNGVIMWGVFLMIPFSRIDGE
jgi:hypothetical protein